MRGTDRVVVAASFPSIPARAAVLKGRVGPVLFCLPFTSPSFQSSPLPYSLPFPFDDIDRIQVPTRLMDYGLRPVDFLLRFDLSISYLR